MADAGKLERLVTDIYWRPDSLAGRSLQGLLGSCTAKLLGAHAHAPVPSSLVTTCSASGWGSHVLDKIPYVPFSLRAQAARATDRTLGRTAGLLARRTGAALLSYSYYGHSAFEAAGPHTPRLLFQLHPHPRSMRQILRRELAAHPDCASSLEKEWELALAEDDFTRLCEEPQMAQHLIAASSFTRQTLIENGTDPERVYVAPYGVDLARFYPSARLPGAERALRILFVGTVNQRKGIKYLLEALQLLGTRHIELVIRGRAVDDLQMVRSMAPDADIRLSVGAGELLAAYQSCDLFVFPSIGEGFGHVLLEALASGLPVLSTTATAAPDLITEGVDGFVVEPRNAAQIAERLEWASVNREQLRDMRFAARAKAEQFTWQRFRNRVVEIVETALGEQIAGASEPFAPLVAQHA